MCLSRSRWSPSSAPLRAFCTSAAVELRYHRSEPPVLCSAPLPPTAHKLRCRRCPHAALPAPLPSRLLPGRPPWSSRALLAVCGELAVLLLLYAAGDGRGVESEPTWLNCFLSLSCLCPLHNAGSVSGCFQLVSQGAQHPSGLDSQQRCWSCSLSDSITPFLITVHS